VILVDKIIMKNMEFYGYHGVLEEENRFGQKFIVTMELFADLKSAGISDDLRETINYAEVYEIVKNAVEKKLFKLIEALGEDIATTVLKRFSSVKELTVKVKKPSAPIKGTFEYFGVEIRRIRNG
jgi:dihydroneopterin aldolase